MRITNRMMTNNMLYNINNNKNSLSKLDDQYATGLKIQKPSDDPIVAVRALKLRTNLSELNQYYEKNIPDAKAWMETTESALKITSEIITKLHTYCVQGANDTLTETERRSIGDNLMQLADQINQEGNANYAGRYLFTGYKTNTALVFDDEEHDLNYTITERFTADQIQIGRRIVNTCDLNEFDIDDPESFDTTVRPSEATTYRLQLSYDQIKTIDDGGSLSIKIPEKDEDGNYVYDDDGVLQYTEELDDSSVNVFDSSSPTAYLPEAGEINYIEDTGEIIMGSEVYNTWRESDFEITYQKSSFAKNELRPEHYFDCVVEDMTIEDEDERLENAIHYTLEDQQISYEVNFNQKLKINVQGRDAFKHELGRCLEDISKAVSDVARVKESIEMVETYLKDDSLEEEQIAKLKEIREVLGTELDLKDGVLRSAFDRGIGVTQAQEDIVNNAVADSGTRYNRIELTESRLSTQQTEFTDLMSQNEDADIVETVVNHNAMETIYNASLSAASKVVKNTLLDFL